MQQFLSQTRSILALVGIMLGSFLLSQCASVPKAEIATNFYRLQDSTNLPPIILTTGEVKREYEELGIITAQQSTWGILTVEGINAGMRVKARELGADAVIRIDYSGRIGSFVIATGTAVKYK